MTLQLSPGQYTGSDVGLWDFGTLLCFQLIICPLLQLALETKCWVGFIVFSLPLMLHCSCLDLDTSHSLPDVHRPLCRVWPHLQRGLLRRQVPRAHQPLLGDAGESGWANSVSPPHTDRSSLHHAQVGCPLSLSLLLITWHLTTPGSVQESSWTPCIPHSSLWPWEWDWRRKRPTGGLKRWRTGRVLSNSSGLEYNF